MSNVGYNFEGTENFVIKNNIIEGIKEECKITHNNFGEVLLERMKANPSFVGQIDGLTGREETMAEMIEKSVKCAIWLKEQNVQRGDIVGICTHNQTDMYVPCLASMYIGAIFNAWWDVGLTKEVTEHIVNLTHPKVLFVSETWTNMIDKVVKEMGEEMKIIVFGKLPDFQSLNDILATHDNQSVREFSCEKLATPDDPVVTMYTSGSTGLPKAVVLSHKSLHENIYRFSEWGRIENVGRTILFSPLSWLSGVYTMLRGICVPETRIIYPEFVEEKTFQLIEKFKINWMLLGISAAYRLTKSPSKTNYDRSSIRTILVGGSTLKAERQNELAEVFPDAIVYQGYGATELGNAGVQQDIICKYGSCGRVLKNIALKVVDIETNKTLGPNQTGEACFKSSYMMTCYYNNPKATREVIDAEGWLHSGDLVYYDEEGYIFFVERMKEMIKYRGNHVSPGMIEQVLENHPEVLQSAVLSIPHEIDDEHPIAFVVKVPGGKVQEKDLRELVANTLPDYMKLRGGVKFLDKLPHTSSDKVARSELRNMAKSYAYINDTKNFNNNL